MNFDDLPLLGLLRQQDPTLYGRLLETRRMAQRWLGYIPATFPHYTQHSVEHSDAIAEQMSRLLFTDGDPSRPVLHLSPVEVYILLVAAYLHDAGMVVSDSEKTQILASQEWESFIEVDGAGHTRWTAIQQLRASATPDIASASFFRGSGDDRR
jgi:molecular chaperone HtpG